MKVLFIYFNLEYRPRVPNALSLLETVVQQEGHETRVFDTSFYAAFQDLSQDDLVGSGIRKPVENLTIEPKRSDPYADLRREVERFDPALVAFSYYAANQPMQRRLLSRLKKEFPRIRVIAGGVQPCLAPERCLAEDYIDLLCFGEGEALLRELCNRMEADRDWSDIPGLWFKRNGTVIQNGLAPLTDLSELPLLNWDSFPPVHLYGLFEGHAYRMGHVEATRGCPYNCSYCASGALRKVYRDAGVRGYVRHKSAAQFVAECAALKQKYDLEMFYILDGTFTVKPRRLLEELAPLFAREVGVPFIALVRPETISPRVAELLATMGCVQASMGIESGVPEYRVDVLNRRMSDQQIVDAVHHLKAHDIGVSTYNMIGLPGMDREHVFRTIALNKRSGSDSSIVSIFVPFPDNELTKFLLARGMIRTTDIKYSKGTAPNVEIAEMSAEEIVGLFRTFNIYTKVPRALYPLIRPLERENRVTRTARKVLIHFLR